MFKSLMKSCNIYFALWVLYYLQGILYRTGSIISQLTLLFVLLFSCYHVVNVNKTIAIPSFLKSLNIFIFILTIYGIVYFFIGDEFIIRGRVRDKFEPLKNIYISLLPVYSFYYFTKKKMIDEKWITKIIFFLLSLSIYNFFNYKFQALQRAEDIGYVVEEITNNAGYEFCALLPLFFFLRRNHIIQYILLLTCIVFIIMAMKRGAIIISSFLVVYYLYKEICVSSKKRRLLLVVSSSCFIICGIYFAMDFIANSSYFKYRLNETLEGNSSGRDFLYTKLISWYLNDTSLLEFIFGGGTYNTIKIAGNVAHNDWIELAVCQGLLGIIIYIHYFISLRFDTKRLKYNNNPDYYIVMNMLFIIMFLSTLFSMSYGYLSLSTKIALGYCLGQITLKTKKYV